jgi:hypothetical protein
VTAKRHHYVPQSYLLGFADGNKRLMTVPLDGVESYIQSVENAAAESYYNAFVDEQGERSMVVEEQLSAIEGDGVSAIKRILSGEFPPKDQTRVQLATYLGLQVARSPRTRAMLDQIVDRTSKIMVAFSGPSGTRKVLEDKGHELSDEEAAALWRTASAFDNYRVTPHQNRQIQQMLDSIFPLAEPFAVLPWGMVRFQHRALLTCDNPVGMWRPADRSRHQGWTHGIGVATADELWFPLDRRTALLVSPHLPTDGLRLRATTKWAQRINQIIALWAHRFIYHHPKDDPLAGLWLPPVGEPMSVDGPDLKEVAARMEERDRRPH